MLVDHRLDEGERSVRGHVQTRLVHRFAGVRIRTRRRTPRGCGRRRRPPAAHRGAPGRAPPRAPGVPAPSGGAAARARRAPAPTRSRAAGGSASRRARPRRGRPRWSSTFAHTSSTPSPVRPEQVTTAGAASRPVHHPQRARQVTRGHPRLGLPVAVGLVDRDHVGELEDPALDALELVAGAGQGQEAGRCRPCRPRWSRTGRRRRSRPAPRRTPRPRARGSPGWSPGPRRRACRRWGWPGCRRRGRWRGVGIRVLSPSTEPPVRWLLGSTARTPTR